MLITLLTDFGSQSPYVAMLKGLALRSAPTVQIIDISHAVQPGNSQEGQFLLNYCCPTFPAHAVHLAVVDPGVGTGRRALAIQTAAGFFVGPDNGIFTCMQERATAIHEISNPAIISPTPAPTFHGRDIFLPAALHLAADRPIGELGPPVGPAALISTPLPEPVVNDRSIHGTVIYGDHFGNLITNITCASVTSSPRFHCRFGDWHTNTLTSTYGMVQPQTTILTCSSFGLLEIAVNGGSAAERFRIDRHCPTDCPITIQFDTTPGR
ncbi:MAG: SAM-dependent chlorinase/fluorinase [Deltaproteobacteria bacterium]|nr:SAM-dependent chlorinase/fluorinase [Candidatus Anaeroferrophillus wilburensis]MBN2889484.1 SAM-dependent chlorinase/fluorinase [Deltaproteobacteria bacterium]